MNDSNDSNATEAIDENPDSAETVVEKKPVENDTIINEELASIIQSDLEKRGIALHLVVGSDKDGRLQLIGYDSSGIVDHLSRKVDMIKFYESSFDSRAMRPMSELYLEPRKRLYFKAKSEEEEVQKELKAKNKGSKERKWWWE